MFGLNKKGMILFACIFLFSLLGVFGSAFMLDNYIDNCIAKMQPNVTNEIVVNVYNNTNSKVNVEHNKDGSINVHITDKDKIDSSDNKYIPKQGIVTAKSGLNIRHGADIKSDKVGVLEYGEQITIIDETDYWYKIDRGYIFKEYIELCL